MARRIHGDIDVRRRPDGGAVITLKSATGEAFEIERTADQTAALHEKLAAPSITPSQDEQRDEIEIEVPEVVEVPEVEVEATDPVDATTSEGENSDA
jgi:hypothetical protein